MANNFLFSIKPSQKVYKTQEVCGTILTGSLRKHFLMYIWRHLFLDTTVRNIVGVKEKQNTMLIKL